MAENGAVDQSVFVRWVQVPIVRGTPVDHSLAGLGSYGMNSCKKGKRGERAWRDELRAHGYEARRGQQFCGSPNSPDVICADLPGLHFEVKAVERLNIHEAMAQAIEDAGEKRPVVAHKRDRGDWLVTMKADDWFKLLAKTQPGRAGAPR